MKRFGALFPIFATVAIVAASCAHPQVIPPPEAAAPHSWYWIDLRAGWRVRVVTPLARADAHLVEAQPVKARSEPLRQGQGANPTSGAATIDLKGGKDLIGYEVSLYSVRPQHGGGVHVAFRSAVVNSAGQKAARPRPVVPLFLLPREDGFVRVLHLAWGSHGDHEAAILAAESRDSLEALTRKVEIDSSDCVAGRDAFCSWVPAGIAVIPERRKSPGRDSQWAPAY